MNLNLQTRSTTFRRHSKICSASNLIAFRTGSGGGRGGGGERGGGTADETAPSVAPGQAFSVRAHIAQAVGNTELSRVWLVSSTGSQWKTDATGAAAATSAPAPAAAPVVDRVFHVQVANDAQPTAPFFTRPSTEQPYYDIANPAWRLRSFAPWPLEAWAEFTFDGVPIRLGQIVQTLQHATGPGGFYEPLIVAPPIGVRIDPEARILPHDGSALPVKVTVQAQAAAEGTIALKLPEGWRSDPAQIEFHIKSAGNTEPLVFSVTPATVGAGAYDLQAVATVAGHSYQTGWQPDWLPGPSPLQPSTGWPNWKPARIDVKVAAGLRVGYVMGTGDAVPESH